MEEFCHRCGRHQSIVWHADDKLWNKVAGSYPVLCPKCFDDLAFKKRIGLRWVSVEYDPFKTDFKIVLNRCNVEHTIPDFISDYDRAANQEDFKDD